MFNQLPAIDLSSNAVASRRAFLLRSGLGLGSAALSSLLPANEGNPPSLLTHAPRAKRVIYVFQAGGPAQMELYDHKPELAQRHGDELPESVLKQQRLTGFTVGQKNTPSLPHHSDLRSTEAREPG